jgi:multicomponent Na+:H+ antiporter subunit B
LIIDVLLTMSVMAVVALAGSRNLFTVVVLMAVYSFLMATAFVALDAVDVAMTEAAVGAGVSTVLLLGALRLCRSEEAKQTQSAWIPLCAAIAVAALLVYGALGLPPFSDPGAPIHTHVAARYLEEAVRETGVPNVVTVVLASYRGFDTLGEVVVVFTAGVGVIALLRRRRAGRVKGKAQ